MHKTVERLLRQAGVRRQPSVPQIILRYGLYGLGFAGAVALVTWGGLVIAATLSGPSEEEQEPVSPVRVAEAD